MQSFWKSCLALVLVSAIFLSLALPLVAQAKTVKIMRTSVLHNDDVDDFEELDEDDNSAIFQENCAFVPEDDSEPDYDSQFLSIRKKLQVEMDEEVSVKVFLQNKGNRPWYSHQSRCSGRKVYLGADSPRDRASQFYTTGWVSPNRIAMDQLRVNPGEIASFSFNINSGSETNAYMEYFTPVFEGFGWDEEDRIDLKLIVGEVKEEASNMRKRFLFAAESGSVMNFDLNGEKMVAVDLSEQKMNLLLDGKVIRKFTVSTGARATPTPVGDFSISLKQETRVGGQAPHYIMPKFQWFKAGGYGLHALPKLRNDNGLFWEEARNHIGIPVSHGCIRMLPEDADFAYEFTDIGTKLIVQR
jgi:lipoprotein-anchoring transpeptidase ErfK/SrfK